MILSSGQGGAGVFYIYDLAGICNIRVWTGHSYLHNQVLDYGLHKQVLGIHRIINVFFKYFFNLHYLIRGVQY